MGNIVADDKGRADFRIIDKLVRIQDMIGRSLAVTSKADDLARGTNDGNSGEKYYYYKLNLKSKGRFKNIFIFQVSDVVSLHDQLGSFRIRKKSVSAAVRHCGRSLILLHHTKTDDMHLILIII